MLVEFNYRLIGTSANDIAEILLKVVLNTINQNQNLIGAFKPV